MKPPLTARAKQDSGDCNEQAVKKPQTLEDQSFDHVLRLRRLPKRSGQVEPSFSVDEKKPDADEAVCLTAETRPQALLGEQVSRWRRSDVEPNVYIFLVLNDPVVLHDRQ